MANSESHKVGEFIGTFFELAMKGPIKEFCDKNKLYFDSYGYRKARGKDKITWVDIKGSRHDLDYVIEEGGTEEKIGTPIAFIELAWRRYTKHSKNKVGEIQAAIDPICQKYSTVNPFKGAFLCGEFTKTSIDQFKKDGFSVVYIPFSTLVKVFKKHNVNIDYDEKTSETVFKKTYDNLQDIKIEHHDQLVAIANDLKKACKKDIDAFIKKLTDHYLRKIKVIKILPLHGNLLEIDKLSDAIAIINKYDEKKKKSADFVKFEIYIEYNNGEEIKAEFFSKRNAIEFLNKFN